VTASRYVVGRCYATFDGHRNNDYKTYVYLTEDYGKTWTSIKRNLPDYDPTYVIKEGLRNANLLLLGSELGMYVSLDRGQSWNPFVGGNFPTVPVHDLVLHPRDGDIVVGTHGRSIWTVPYSVLEELTTENLAKEAHLAKPSPIYQFGRVSGKNWDGDGVWQSPNTQPGTFISYYLRQEAKEAKIVVSDIEGRSVFERDVAKTPGVNVVYWNARVRTPIRPGDYRVTLIADGKEYISSVKVEDVTDTGQASPPR
jgi:hypothetical protein